MTIRISTLSWYLVGSEHANNIIFCLCLRIKSFPELSVIVTEGLHSFLPSENLVTVICVVGKWASNICCIFEFMLRPYSLMGVPSQWLRFLGLIELSYYCWSQETFDGKSLLWFSSLDMEWNFTELHCERSYFEPFLLPLYMTVWRFLTAYFFVLSPLFFKDNFPNKYCACVLVSAYRKVQNGVLVIFVVKLQTSNS